MEYFKVNYGVLQNLRQIKFYKIVLIILIILVLLLKVAHNSIVWQHIECESIYINDNLSLTINVQLSDKLKKAKYITFNDAKANIDKINYGDYEMISNEVYQNINLIIDRKFSNNEVGVLKIYYEEKSILKIVLDLFK